MKSVTIFLVWSTLRWIKEWICSERTIICAIVKAWPEVMALISFVFQRNLHTTIRRTILLGYSPQLACSGWPAGPLVFFIYVLDGPKRDQVGWPGYLNPNSGSPATILGSPATFFAINFPRTHVVLWDYLNPTLGSPTGPFLVRSPRRWD